jgi:hypothetical protein
MSYFSKDIIYVVLVAKLKKYQQTELQVFVAFFSPSGQIVE